MVAEWEKVLAVQMVVMLVHAMDVEWVVEWGIVSAGGQAGVMVVKMDKGLVVQKAEYWDGMKDAMDKQKVEYQVLQ